MISFRAKSKSFFVELWYWKNFAISRGKQLSGAYCFICCKRAAIAIFLWEGDKQLSERAGRPLYIANFHIVRFPGVRGQTTISVGKNQLHVCSSFSYNP